MLTFDCCDESQCSKTALYQRYIELGADHGSLRGLVVSLCGCFLQHYELRAVGVVPALDAVRTFLPTMDAFKSLMNYPPCVASSLKYPGCERSWRCVHYYQPGRC
jgi:hypothetical protein